MSTQEPQKDDRKPPYDEDTEAILNRRRFLIQSSLASAGIGAAMSGCRAEPQGEPCLSVAEPEPEPQPCLDEGPPEPGPEPCLSMPAPEPEPCLEVAPPESPGDPTGSGSGASDPGPSICLTIQ